MRALLTTISTLLIFAEIGVACGGGGDGTGPGPNPPVFTTLAVTPGTATLFTVAPGNAVALTAVPKDQNGQTIAGLGSATFSTDNAAVAGVGADGTATAAAAGTALITASLTAGGVTKTGTSTVTVQVAPATTGVFAPEFEFQPPAADVSAGGIVTWTFGPIHHTVTFSDANAPDDVPELQDGSASRTFPTNGSFNYRCSIHPSMAGVVRVH
jgi:plastocyanin